VLRYLHRQRSPLSFAYPSAGIRNGGWRPSRSRLGGAVPPLLMGDWVKNSFQVPPGVDFTYLWDDLMMLDLNVNGLPPGAAGTIAGPSRCCLIT